MGLPRHIAIIMDGNRRWAKKNKLSILAGHNYAAQKTIEPIIDYLADKKIGYVTFWAFSTENWRRDSQEVKGLIEIFRQGLKQQGERLLAKKYRLKVIGDYTAFPADIVEMINYYQEKSADFDKMTVIFALNYGGRDEIVRAVGKMARHSPKSFLVVKKKDWLTRKEVINQLANFLDTAGVPDPDMVIRTGGEKRLSGFLLWQIEYAELFFTSTLWPDFKITELEGLIKKYQLRQRRFGH